MVVRSILQRRSSSSSRREGGATVKESDAKEQNKTETTPMNICEDFHYSGEPDLRLVIPSVFYGYAQTVIGSYNAN